MDDYTLQQELEALADNAFNPEFDEQPGRQPINDTTNSANLNKAEPISTTIVRWTRLFPHLTPYDAVEQIQLHRNNLVRPRVSGELWQTVRAEQERLGFDREAYEYSLDSQRKRALLPTSTGAVGASSPTADSRAGRGSGGGGGGEERLTYLVELTGPLDSVAKVQTAAGLDEGRTLELVEGKSVEDGRKVQLCCIDGAARSEILRWVANELDGSFEPVILIDPRSTR